MFLKFVSCDFSNQDAGRMLEGRVECSRFHWPVVAGTKGPLFTRLVCILDISKDN